MPRNVRNFWLTLDVDGKKEPVSSGPQSKDGGFSLEILIRENGSVSDKKVKIVGNVTSEGDLVIEAGSTDPTIWVSDNNRSAILLTSKR